MIPISIKKNNSDPEKEKEVDSSEKSKSSSEAETSAKEAETQEKAEEKAAEEGVSNDSAPSEDDAPKSEEATAKEVPDELSILNDKYLRICAEYDNFRKRSQKEKDSLYGDIRIDVIKSILPIYDNLERALSQPTADEAYRKGVEMTMNQFQSVLEKLGVTEIPALGEKFDPQLHNAVMHIEDKTKGENEIVDVFQKGFKLGDKVIRFSMVRVAN